MLDLRKRIFDLLEAGKSKKFISRMLKICTKTILNSKEDIMKRGKIDKIIPQSTKPRKVDYEKVRKYIEENPDKTLKEVGIIFI